MTVSIETQNSMKESEVAGSPKTETKKNPYLCEDYEPYEHGNQTHATTFWDTVIHLTRAMIGSGILAIPFAVKEVGYVIGVGGIILTGTLYLHVTHILLSVEHKLCKRLKVPNLTYVKTVKYAFETGPSCGKPGKQFAIFLIYFDYVVNGILSKSMFMVILAINCKILIDHYATINVNLTTVVSVIVIPLFLISWSPNFKFLVSLSAISNVFNFLIYILILCISGTSVGEQGTNIQPIGNIYQFPAFFALILGAYTCTKLTLPLKNEMKNPKRFATPTGVLNVSGSITILIYILFGFIAYLKYGSKTQPSIFENLPQDQLLSLLVIAVYCVSICSTFVLYLFVTLETIWDNYLGERMEGSKYLFFAEYGLRNGIVAVSFLVTLILPNFELIASIIGTIGILIDIGVAPLLDILVLTSASKRRKYFYAIILKDILIVILALGLFSSGFAQVASRIMKFYNVSHS